MGVYCSHIQVIKIGQNLWRDMNLYATLHYTMCNLVVLMLHEGANLHLESKILSSTCEYTCICELGAKHSIINTLPSFQQEM